MKPLVWCLDDEPTNTKTVKTVLEMDGWKDRDDTSEEPGNGVAFEPLNSKNTFLETLSSITDRVELPCLFLLDVDLSGSDSQHQDQFGGFEVWRAILEKCRELRATDLPWMPRIVLYTRSNNILPLAKYMDHELAQPQIIPFGAAARLCSTDDVQSALSAPLTAALSIIAGHAFSHCDSKEYETLLNEVNVAENIGALMAVKLGSHRLSNLVPQYFYMPLDRDLDAIKQQLREWISRGNRSLREIFSEILDSFRNEPDLPFRRDIDLEEIGIGVGITRDIRRKAIKAGSFFSVVPQVYWQGSEKKMGHLIQAWLGSSTAIRQEWARKLILGAAQESEERWGRAVESFPTVVDSRVWRCLLRIAKSHRLVKSDLASFNDAIRQYDFTEIADSFPLGRAISQMAPSMIEPRDRGKTLAVAIEDLRRMSEGVFHTLSGLDTYASASYDNRWFGGASRKCIHFFCSRGKVEEWDEARTMAAMISPRPTTNSLSELAHLVCRVYGGQLIVGKTDRHGARIDGMLVRYPGLKGCGPATAEQRGAIFRDWSENLSEKEAMSFNIISFALP